MKPHGEPDANGNAQGRDRRDPGAPLMRGIHVLHAVYVTAGFLVRLVGDRVRRNGCRRRFDCRNRRDEPVAFAGIGENMPIFSPFFSQHLAQRRDALREVVLFHRRAFPYALQHLLFGHRLTRPPGNTRFAGGLDVALDGGAAS